MFKTIYATSQNDLGPDCVPTFSANVVNGGYMKGSNMTYLELFILYMYSKVIIDRVVSL